MPRDKCYVDSVGYQGLVCRVLSVYIQLFLGAVHLLKTSGKRREPFYHRTFGYVMLEIILLIHVTAGKVLLDL